MAGGRRETAADGEQEKTARGSRAGGAAVGSDAPARACRAPSSNGDDLLYRHGSGLRRGLASQWKGIGGGRRAAAQWEGGGE